MRTFSLPGTAGLDQSRLLRSVGGLFVLIGSAVLIGEVIAKEQWNLLALVGAVIIAVQWPIEAALGAYAFLIPFESIVVVGEGTSGLAILGALTAIGLLGMGIIRKRLSWPPRAAWWWAGLVLWSILTGLWALQPEATVRLIPTVVSVILLYLVAVSWRISEKQFTILTRLLIAGACLASCFVIYQYLNGVTYRHSATQGGRASFVVGGTEENPNAFGADLLLPFALTLAEFLSARRNLHKVFAVGAAALIACAVFLTMSRGALLAIALIFLIYLFSPGFKRRMLAVAAALVLVVVVMPATFFYRLQTAISTGGAGRLEIWQASLFVLRKYWLTGAGLNNFTAAYSEFAGYAPKFAGFARGAHNIFLETAVEVGIVGLLLMCAALVAHFRAVRRLRQTPGLASIRALALECALWATLLDSFFESGSWHKSFWLTWMLALMATRLSRESSQGKVIGT